MSSVLRRFRLIAAGVLLFCTGLPCYTAESDDSVFSGDTAIPGITWVLERTQGLQAVARVDEGAGGLLFSPGTSYLDMRYHGMILTVNVRELFSLKTVLNIGFLQNEMPMDFSITTLPFRNSEWTSVEFESFALKSFPASYRSKISLFAGYSLLQYTLNDREDKHIVHEERIYHSILVGSQITFRPVRFITLDYGISFSPFSMLDFSMLSVFQLNYEISVTVSAGILSLTCMITTRNNIEYAQNSKDVSSLRIADSSVRFQIHF